MGQFKAEANKKYYNPATGQEVSYTPEQLKDESVGFLSDQFTIGSAPIKTRYTNPATEGTYKTETEKYLKDMSKPVDESAIRKAKADEAQAQIDAINKRFDVAVATEQEAGRGYLGQARSAGARGGLLGSDFGAAQLKTTEEKNLANVEAINAKRGLEIANIFANVDARATEEINKKTEMALKGRETYLSWLKENQDQAKTDFTNLAKTGGIKSLSELSDEDYKKLLDQTGYDEATAKLTFNANLPSNQKIDYQFKIEGNKLVAYGIDPVTKQISLVEKQLKDDVPSNYKPTVLPDGTLIFTPDKIDSTKPIKDQVIMYGAEEQFSKGTPVTKMVGKVLYQYDDKTKKWSPAVTKSSGPTPPIPTGTFNEKEAVKEMTNAIKVVTGSDGFISPEDHQLLRKQWIDAGGTVTSFDTKFKGYLNPNNPNYITKKQ